MANNETLIPIPGRLHSVTTDGISLGANEVLDDTLQKDQATINQEVQQSLGAGGSVDSRIAAAVDVEKTRAEAAEGALDTRVDTLEDAVGTGGSVDSRISAAVATEASRAQAAEADRYTKEETYNKTELNNLITTPNQEYVSVTATDQTTSVTDVLPATGAADTTYRVGNWDGTQYNDSVFSEYAWNGSTYIKLSTKSQIGEVYDISANHADTKYADLADALGTNGANIPQSLQKGGMSIKYVQSSDKYVQYRLMAEEFTTDTTQWAIADEGVYVENLEFVRVVLDNENKILEATRVEGTKLLPAGVEINNKINFEGNETTIIESPEFVEVKLDNAGHILWGIQKDGNVYFGAGVPQQVINYIEDRIKELSLDEYEDIVSFLADLEKGDETLQNLLDKKVDGEYEENPEFLEVNLDAENKVLEGIQQDGTKVIGGDLKVLGNIEVSGVSYKVIENPEYLAAWVDAENKVVFGLKADGKTYVGDADFLNDIKNNQEAINEINSTIDSLDINALSSITTVENPEFLEAKTDSEGKILAGRTNDGAAFENIGFTTPKISIDGHIIENIEDPEGRSEVTTDSEGKIISYRDVDGVKHEQVGIETDYIILSQNGQKKLQEDLNAVPIDKNWYLPKFGNVNIKEETFYLDAGDWSSYANDVVLIQIYDDTDANSAKGLTLSTFYIKNTITPLAGGGYDKTSVNANSVALDLHAGKDVTAVGDKFFATAIYTPVMEGERIVSYTKNKATKVIDPVSGDVTGYTYNGQSTEVKQVKDVPPYKAWKVTKTIEHYCSADIDFGTFYSKTNVPVSIKYQGASTLYARKKGFRITFYKNSSFAKKAKVKFGEMLRLSSYNMKSFYNLDDNVNDPVASNTLREIYESRGESCYPWNANNLPYNGATGFIKSFPIETLFGTEFYGIQYFGLKKDEKNYMLDGDDDASGIFVSGDINGDFADATPRQWADEMGVDERTLAYPDWEDSVSVETAAAMTELFKRTKGFVDGTIEIDGEVVSFENFMLEEYIDLKSWIDYYIGFQVFQLWDNTYHNVIMYTGSDKKKFYLFFYDVDQIVDYNYNQDVFDVCTSRSVPVAFWQKFRDEYKDNILNRYTELRKEILTYSNISSIYESYIAGIPDEIVGQEVARWDRGNPATFKTRLEKLKNRLVWLDNTCFNIDIN